MRYTDEELARIAYLKPDATELERELGRRVEALLDKIEELEDQVRAYQQDGTFVSAP